MILFPHVLNSKGIFDNNQKLALDIGFYITAKLQEISQMRIRVCQTIDNFVVRSRARWRKTNQPLKKENKRKIGAPIENGKLTIVLH